MRFGHHEDPPLSAEAEVEGLRKTLAEVLVGKSGIEIRFCVCWEEAGNNDIVLAFYDAETENVDEKLAPIPISLARPCAEPMQLSVELTTRLSLLVGEIEAFPCRLKLELESTPEEGITGNLRMVEMPPTVIYMQIIISFPDDFALISICSNLNRCGTRSYGSSSIYIAPESFSSRISISI